MHFFVDFDVTALLLGRRQPDCSFPVGRRSSMLVDAHFTAFFITPSIRIMTVFPDISICSCNKK